MICVQVASGGFPPQLQLCSAGDKGHREDGRVFGQPFAAGLVSRVPKGIQSIGFRTDG